MGSLAATERLTQSRPRRTLSYQPEFFSPEINTEMASTCLGKPALREGLNVFSLLKRGQQNTAQ